MQVVLALALALACGRIARPPTTLCVEFQTSNAVCFFTALIGEVAGCKDNIVMGLEKFLELFGASFRRELQEFVFFIL